MPGIRVQEVIIQENQVYIGLTFGSGKRQGLIVKNTNHSVLVRPADFIWFDSKYAYWTTRDKQQAVDVTLQLTSNPYVKPPAGPVLKEFSDQEN